MKLNCPTPAGFAVSGRVPKYRTGDLHPMPGTVRQAPLAQDGGGVPSLD
jgi:hypothetical protein